jgi:hypothetical protein
MKMFEDWTGIQAHGDLRVDGRGEIVWRGILDTHPGGCGKG